MEKKLSLAQTEPKRLHRSRLEIICNDRAVIAVKIKKGRCFGIAFSTDVTEEQAQAMARDAHASEWRKIDTSSLRFL
jgi:endo-beta-N-acetylglucosaminidase D